MNLFQQIVCKLMSNKRQPKMKEKYSISKSVGQFAIGDQTIGKTLSDGTKKFTLDEAIQIAGSGRFNLLIIVLTGIALMGATIENISIAFVMPYAFCDLNMTTTEQGLISSIAFLGIVISSHFWGFLADTWGRKKVIRLTATCALISALLSAFSINATFMIFFRFFVGVFISGLQASVFSYVSEFHTKETAPRAASFVSMFMPTIMIYSAIWGMLIIPMNWGVDLMFIKFTPWRLYIICITSVNAINTLAFSFLPETPKFLLATNKHDEALDVLRSMYKINTGYLKESYPVQHLIREVSTNNFKATKGASDMLKLMWGQTKPIFVVPYLDSTVKLCFMIFTLFAVGHGTMLWLADFLIRLLNNQDPNKSLCDVVGHEKIREQQCNIDNGDTTTFQVMLYIGIVFTILSAMISFYLNRLSPRILVPVWIIFSAICSVALNFLTEFYSIIIAFVIFTSSSLCAAIVSAISVNLYPTNVRAMATCFIYMFGRIGGLAGGNLIGIFIKNHCNVIFYVFGVLSFVCALVFLLIRKEAPEHVEPVTDKQRNECTA